jgi:hypothetical protein
MRRYSEVERHALYVRRGSVVKKANTCSIMVFLFRIVEQLSWYRWLMSDVRDPFHQYGPMLA